MRRQHTHRNTVRAQIPILLLVAAASLALPTSMRAASGNQATAGNETPRREIYVPFDDLKVLLQQQPKRMLLSRKEYETLLKEAKTKPESHVPLAAAILSGDYSIDVHDQRSHISGKLEIDVLEDGLHAVPLDLGGVGLLDAKLDGRPASIGRGERSGLRLFVRGKGRHELTLRMVTPLRTTAAQQVLNFRLPRPPVAAMQLTIPGDVEIKSGAKVVDRTVDEGGGVTRFRLLPNSGDTALVMTLNSHLRRRQRAIVARSVLIDEVTEAYEKLHASVSLGILHKAVDRFRFRLPQGFKVTEVSSELLSRWQIEQDGDDSILVVELREPATGTVLLNLSAVKTPNDLDEWTMPRLEPLDVVGQVAVVGLLLQQRLSAESIEATGLIAIDTSTLGRALPQTAQRTEPGKPQLQPVVAYYAPQTDYTLSARFKKPPAKMAVTTNLLLVVGEAEHEILGGLAMLPRVEKRFGFDFSVPAGWHVLSVTDGRGQPLAFERYGAIDQPSRIHVRVPQGIPLGEEYKANFQARRTPPGWLDDWRQKKIIFPRFTVQATARDVGAVAVAVRDDMAVRPEKIDPQQLALLDESEKAQYGLAGVATNLAYRYETPDYEAALMISRTTPRVTATTYSFLSVNPEALSAHYELNYDVAEARTRQLALSLPENTPQSIAIRGLDGLRLKQYDSRVEDGRRRWTVVLEEATRGALRLAVDFKKRLPEQEPKDYALPVVRAEDVAYQSGVIAVEGNAELDVQVKTEARREDVGELVDADYRPGRRLLGVFGFVGKTADVAVDVFRHPGYGLQSAIVEKATLDTYLSAEGPSQTEARLQLRTKALFLEVKLPPKSQLWSAEVDGKPIKPQREGDSLLVSLPATGRAARQLHFVYETPLCSVVLLGKIDVHAPRLLLPSADKKQVEVPLADLAWNLHVPPGYEVTGSGGTLETTDLKRPLPAAVYVAGAMYYAAGGMNGYGAVQIAQEASEAAHRINSKTGGRGGYDSGVDYLEEAPTAAAPCAEAEEPKRDADRPTGVDMPDVTQEGLARALALHGRSQTEKKIEQALESQTTMEFIDTPLIDVVDYLKELHNIEIQIDMKALDNFGVAVDTPITLDLKGISLKSALRLMLRDLELTYTIENEVLLITTEDEASQRLSTIAYPVDDLVVFHNAKGERVADCDPLLGLIQSTVQPNSWDDVGGVGSISAQTLSNSELLVIAQTQEVHEEIADLLALMRRLDGCPNVTTRLKVAAEMDLARKKIDKALESQTLIECVDTPFSDLLENLKKMHGIEIQIDRRALDEAGIDFDIPITRNLKGVTLRSALELILRDYDLTYQISDEVLLITTNDEACQRLQVLFYPVEDLVVFRDENNELWSDNESLMELIQSTVDANSWCDVGGTGSVGSLSLKNTQLLVIAQTQDTHKKIAQMLGKLRTLNRRQRGDGRPPLKRRPPPGPSMGMGGMGGTFGGMGDMGGGMGMFAEAGADAPETAKPDEPITLRDQVLIAPPTKRPQADRSLQGVQSLKITLAQKATAGGQEISFASLGDDPRLQVTLANRSRFTALGWGLALLVWLLGVAMGNRPPRTKCRFVVAVSLAATLLPLAVDNTALAWVCNMAFFAACLLVPYYLLFALIRKACQKTGFVLSSAGLKSATTALLLVAVTANLALAQTASDDPFGGDPFGDDNNAAQNDNADPFGNANAPQSRPAPKVRPTPPKKRTPADTSGRYVIEAVEALPQVALPGDAVVLPYDPESKDGIRNADRLLVPYARYVELWNRAHPDKKIGEPKTPVPYSLAGIAYTATTAGEEYLLVEGKMQIDVFTDKFVSVPLSLAGGVLSRAELDGKPARLSVVHPRHSSQQQSQAASPGGPIVTLHIEGKGRHTLELSARMAIKRQGGWRVVHGNLPHAAATSLTITVPKPQTELYIGQIADRQSYETQKPDETITTALESPAPGSGGVLNVQWRPKVAQRQVDRSLTAQSAGLFDVEEDGLRMLWQLKLDFPGGQREKFTIDVPADYLVERVEGGNVRGWQSRREVGRHLVDVVLLSTAKESEMLVLQLSKSVAVGTAELAEFEVPSVAVPAAALHEGKITIRHSPLLELRATEHSGLQRTNLGNPTDNFGDLAGDKDKALGIRSFQAYRFTATPFEIKLAATATKAKTSAEVQSVLAFDEYTRTLETQLLLHVEGRPVFRVQAYLPDGFELEQVVAPGEYHWAITEDRKGRLLSVYLAEGRQGEVAVRLTGTLGTPGSIDRLEVPRFEVLETERQSGDVAVQVGPAITVEARKLHNCESVLPGRLYGWLNPSQREVTRLALRHRGADYGGTLLFERRRPLVSCTTVSNVRVTDRIVKETIVLRFNIRHAGTDQLSFGLPAYMADSRISVPKLRQKTIEPTAAGEGSPLKVSLELQEKVMGEVIVLVENDRLLSPDQLHVAPIPTVTGGRTDRRFVVIESAGGDEVVVEPPEQLEALSRQQKEWATLKDLLGSNITKAYVVGSDAKRPKLAFKVDRRAAVQTAGARIELASTVLVLDANGAYRAGMTLKCDNTTEQFLLVRLPEGARLWTARVAGQPVKPVTPPGKAPSRLVRIPLIKMAAGDLDFDVVLKYGGKMPSLGRLSSVDFPLIHTENVKPELSQVKLCLPESYKWLDFGGTMSLVSDEDDLMAQWMAYENRQAEKLLQTASSGDKYDLVRALGNYRSKFGEHLAKSREIAGESSSYNKTVQAEYARNAQISAKLEEQVQLQATLVDKSQSMDNRDRLNDFYEGQKVQGTANYKDTAGSNWSGSLDGAKHRSPQSGTSLNAAWLESNSLDRWSNSEGNDRFNIQHFGSVPKGPAASKSSGFNRPGQGQPQANAIAQGKAMSKLAGTGKGQVSGREARKGSTEGDKLKRYQQEVEQKQEQMEKLEHRFASLAGEGEHGTAGGEEQVAFDTSDVTPKFESKQILRGDGPADPAATGLASLDMEIPTRGVVYNFTVPRGEVEITALAASKKTLGGLYQLGLVAVVVVVLGCLLRLAAGGRFGWLAGPGGSTLLICLGILSLLLGIFNIAGLVAIAAGITFKVRRRRMRLAAA